jgi:hypothetical protein
MNASRFATSLLFIMVIIAAGPALAQEQQVTPSTTQAPSITVEEAVLCTAVVNWVPQGVPPAKIAGEVQTPAQAQAAAEAQAPAQAHPAEQAQAPAGGKAQAQSQAPTATASVEFPAGKICCFCKVSGTAPTTIKHAWYFGDKLVRAIELTIDGSPWRTWSEKNVPQEMAGAWKVEIQDASGTVLKTLTFNVK